MNTRYKKSLYESIMKSVSKTIKRVLLNEDIHPDDLKLLNINWNSLNKIHHWWQDIALQSFTKYPASELKAGYISQDIVNKIRRVTNKIPESIVIMFNDEDSWTLCIDHETSYGRSKYSLYAHGRSAPWKIHFSEMNITQKRSIMERLKTKEFYVYNLYRDQYTLVESSTYKEKKGIFAGKLQ